MFRQPTIVSIFQPSYVKISYNSENGKSQHIFRVTPRLVTRSKGVQATAKASGL